MKEMPSMEPSPHTMAGSSRPARSPCSSTNLSVMFSAMSRNVGRLACRATCSRCVAVSRAYVSLRSCARTRVFYTTSSEAWITAQTCRSWVHMLATCCQHRARAGLQPAHTASQQLPRRPHCHCRERSMHLRCALLQLLYLPRHVHAVVLRNFPHLRPACSAVVRSYRP